MDHYFKNENVLIARHKALQESFDTYRRTVSGELESHQKTLKENQELLKSNADFVEKNFEVGQTVLQQEEQIKFHGEYNLQLEGDLQKENEVSKRKSLELNMVQEDKKHGVTDAVSLLEEFDMNKQKTSTRTELPSQKQRLGEKIASARGKSAAKSNGIQKAKSSKTKKANKTGGYEADAEDEGEEGLHDSGIDLAEMMTDGSNDEKSELQESTIIEEKGLAMFAVSAAMTTSPGDEGMKTTTPGQQHATMGANDDEDDGKPTYPRSSLHRD